MQESGNEDVFWVPGVYKTVTAVETSALHGDRGRGGSLGVRRLEG